MTVGHYLQFTLDDGPTAEVFVGEIVEYDPPIPRNRHNPGRPARVALLVHDDLPQPRPVWLEVGQLHVLAESETNDFPPPAAPPIPVRPVRWNPVMKVVMDHRSGAVDHEATNLERAARHLPTPWDSTMAPADLAAPALL